MQAQKSVIGHLAAFVTIFIWGISFISTKVLLVDFSPVEILFYRLVLALLVLFVVSPPRRVIDDPESKPRDAEWKLVAAGLFGVVGYFVFQNVAMTYTLAANVSVLTSVAPLFTALVIGVVIKEMPKAGFFLGFVAAMAGILLIVYNGSVVLKLNPLGDLLSILAALMWAFYTLIIRDIHARQQTGVLTLTRKVLSYGFLLLVPTLPFFAFRLGLERLAVLPNVLNLLFLGIGASALCFITWNYAVSVLGPVKTSVYIYLIPLVALVASAVVLQEPITVLALIGISLILMGMALSERSQR